MTLMTSAEGAEGLLPAEYGDLIVRPTQDLSVAMSVSSVISTGAHDFHLPVVAADATASWVAEGEDLSGDEPQLDELVISPAKVGRVVKVSRELAADSSPEATAQVGLSIARAIAKQVDAAYFGSLSAPAPAGLESLTTSTVTAAGWANLDPFAEAISTAETHGSTITAFVANPADALAMAQVKQAEGSNVPLLGIDPTEPTRRQILGIPLHVSPAVTEGTVWAIPQAQSFVVLREDVSLEVSHEAFFALDVLAVKATMRVGFGWPHPQAVVKISAA